MPLLSIVADMLIAPHGVHMLPHCTHPLMEGLTRIEVMLTPLHMKAPCHQASHENRAEDKAAWK
jgi:hypothetical protein